MTPGALLSLAAAVWVAGMASGLRFSRAWLALFTVSAFFLITLDRQRPEVRAAGWLYLVASHAGTVCLFAFFSTLAARTGSWELGPMREQAALAPLFWLVLAGFGVKAGLFPTEAIRLERVPETVLERVIGLVSAGILQASTAVRRLQHGRLQFYILHAAAGLIALGVLVLLGGTQ